MFASLDHMSQAAQDQAWRPITRLDPKTVETNGRLAALDALRTAWQRELAAVPEDEAVRRRQRSLRRLAIETGIIEKLYDLDWGLTLTLVADGFAREVIERSGTTGRVDEWTLATLHAQRDSLEMVIDFVRSDRKLSPSFIKELHQSITRTQSHYDAVDALGTVVTRELPKGAWKQWPNHVVRQDGSTLEYCPPEHVTSEVDNLTAWYEELETTTIHPIIKAAWLHHRFVQIHPFADGNGRVARALTLLVMQRHHYAPLVVDRHHRAAYLVALDRANEGLLTPLVHLFTNLESAALAGELERTAEPTAETSRQVAHTLAAQLASRRATAKNKQQAALNARATAIVGMARQWLETKQRELRAEFDAQGIADAKIDVLGAQSDRPELMPDGQPRHMFFRRQVIDSAHEAGHYAYFGGFVALLNLRLRLEGLRMSYVVSLHGAGVDSGVMAVTTLCQIRVGNPDMESEDILDVPTTSDAFYFSHAETIAALNDRAAELAELLDAGLTVALAELMRRV